MQERKCKRCGSTENLTLDHIIPKWFAKRAPSFGFTLSYLHQSLPVNRQYSNIQILCSKCNQAKGGYIDYSNPVAREYLRELVKQIMERINAYEHPQLFTPIGLTITPKGVYSDDGQDKYSV